MRLLLAALLGTALVAASCGGSSSQPPPIQNPLPPISISLSSSTVTAGQDGTPVSVTVTVSRTAGDTSSVTLTTTSVPAGVNTETTSPNGGDRGTVKFTPQAPGPPAAGSYPVTINASNGGSVASANLTLVIAIVATVQSTVNTNVGGDGGLNAFMSTSFQPAEWDYQFFTSNPGASATLNNLGPQHIRLQPVSQGTPESSQNTWDFSKLDAILDPVSSVTDNSPELQLAVGPSWMDDPSTGHLEPSHFQDFADYAANVVQYYNTFTGFTDANGQSHVHSAMVVTPVIWWGIFNEPNINGLDASQYVSLYNTVVPAMQAAQSQVPIKFVAVELSDFPGSPGDPRGYLPTFVSGVTAQVDAVATHFYSSCNQSDLDQQVFDTVEGYFAPDVKYIYSQLKTNPNLANAPVWVTENNVNADFPNASGNSTCNPKQKFVTDQRGTSAFFAGWRPYVFSQLTQAGAHALYHWDFGADQQFGEVDSSTGKTYLSYWVDYWLQRYFGFSCESCPKPLGGGIVIGGPGNPAASILNLTSTESTTVETLATTNVVCSGNYVVVMIANHTVMNPRTDNNGPGATRTVIVDVSALGAFSSATQVTIDASTDPAQGPSATPITPASRFTVTLNGYGVTFLQLNIPPTACPLVPSGSSQVK
ncbi:MAG TPA: hypothetical protein VKM93_03115 [Terriglobia bacterium]|nr:hypothetical protein [Terriglobia bacterium]